MHICVALTALRTRAARASWPILPGLAVMCWRVCQRWVSSAKPRSPMQRADRISAFRVRALMSGPGHARVPGAVPEPVRPTRRDLIDVPAGRRLRQAGARAQAGDAALVPEPRQPGHRLPVTAQDAGLFPGSYRTAAGGEQAGNEPDQVPGDAEHDTISGHAEPSGKGGYFGEPSIPCPLTSADLDHAASANPARGSGYHALFRALGRRTRPHMPK